MNKHVCLIILTIISLFIFGNFQVIADEALTAKQVATLINLSSIPKEYSFYNASTRDGQHQVNFINNKSKQRMSFTFAKDMLAKTGDELKSFNENILKSFASLKTRTKENKIVSYKNFFAHNQTICYYNVDEYDNGKLWTKAIMGFLGNYEGKSIVLQSYGPPETFNEKEAINFFSKVKFFIRNF